MITRRLCRKQSRSKIMSNTLFVHWAVESYRNLQRETELLDGTKGGMYVHEATAPFENGKDLNEADMFKEQRLLLYD